MRAPQNTLWRRQRIQKCALTPGTGSGCRALRRGSNAVGRGTRLRSQSTITLPSATAATSPAAERTACITATAASAATKAAATATAVTKAATTATAVTKTAATATPTATAGPAPHGSFSPATKTLIATGKIVNPTLRAFPVTRSPPIPPPTVTVTAEATAAPSARAPFPIMLCASVPDINPTVQVGQSEGIRQSQCRFEGASWRQK
mmetsp:Transcript_80219/g.134065  ORF Transcript_80219/g.134065 Transcript_80219/m.134065 type:complete len:206 (-) Transcript_80219:2082-2699(-)